MPTNQGRSFSITEGGRRWREAAKNNGCPIKDHKSPQRELSRPDDAICFQVGGGGYRVSWPGGEGRAGTGGGGWVQQGGNGTRLGGRGVWKAAMKRDMVFGWVPRSKP